MIEPKVHDLKTDQNNYKEVVLLHKLSEVRLNDRGFRQGDYLFLRETVYTGRQMKPDMIGSSKDGAPLIYTGCTAMVLVTHIHTEEGMDRGDCAPWVVMSIKLLSKAGGKYGN